MHQVFLRKVLIKTSSVICAVSRLERKKLFWLEVQKKRLLFCLFRGNGCDLDNCLNQNLIENFLTV